MSSSSRFGQYRRRWFRRDISEETRKKFNHDLYAFIAAFNHDEQSCLGLLEDGMACFTMLQTKLLKRSTSVENRHQWDHYNLGGELAMTAFLDALSTRSRQLTPESDFILVSLDFEGDFPKIREFGVAAFDTRCLLGVVDGEGMTSTEPNITASNYLSFYRNNRPLFVFGDTKILGAQGLGPAIVNSLVVNDTSPPLSTLQQSNSSTQEAPTPPPRKIILVGQAIHNELRILQRLNLPIENTFPHIAGIIDTADLGKALTGKYHPCGASPPAWESPPRGKPTTAPGMMRSSRCRLFWSCCGGGRGRWGRWMCPLNWRSWHFGCRRGRKGRITASGIGGVIWRKGG